MSSNTRHSRHSHHHHRDQPSPDQYYTSPQPFLYSPPQSAHTPSRIPRPAATPTTASTVGTSVARHQHTPSSASTVSLAGGKGYSSALFAGSNASTARNRTSHGKTLLSNGHHDEKTPTSVASTGSTSRKRARPMSTDLSASSPFASPYSLINHGPSHTPVHMAQFSAPSPPPPVNLNYDLAGGGAYTPGFFHSMNGELGERKLSESSLNGMVRGNNEGRFARREWRSQNADEDDDDVDMEQEETMSPEASFENGNVRTTRVRIQEPTNISPGWGKFMLGVVGGVVGGVLAFCRTPFRGFHAGGGQGYDIPVPPNTPAGQSWRDVTASESLWEDDEDETRRRREDESMTRSYDRLETPIPGEYPPSPDDSDIIDEVVQIDEESERGTKRRQSGKGEWVVVSNGEAAAAAAREHGSQDRSNRLGSPLPDRPSSRQRHSMYAQQSPSLSQRRIAPGKRPKHRVSYAGSPALHQQAQDSSRPSSRGQHRHSLSAIPTSPSKKTSPQSAEAKRYAARIRRDERAVEQKVEKLNDRLLEMIRQGKEALGTKVEIVEEADEMADDHW